MTIFLGGGSEKKDFLQFLLNSCIDYDFQESCITFITKNQEAYISHEITRSS